MKHLASPVEGAYETKTPTRRALAKLQTRAKVLSAARKLFSEQGYEGATIRDIAHAAGMSTGAVFASFTDKSDLFREIMFADIEAVVGAMRDAAGSARDLEDGLVKIFAAGYGFYTSQLPLARAAFSVSWSLDDAAACRSVMPTESLQGLITDQLVRGVAQGELAKDADIKLRSAMLFDCYLANFRKAIFGGWTVEQLQTRSLEQIRVILAGARAD